MSKCLEILCYSNDSISYQIIIIYSNKNFTPFKKLGKVELKIKYHTLEITRCEMLRIEWIVNGHPRVPNAKKDVYILHVLCPIISWRTHTQEKREGVPNRSMWRVPAVYFLLISLHLERCAGSHIGLKQLLERRQLQRHKPSERGAF